MPTRRGKIPNNESSMQIKVYLPESIWTRLRMEVWDPLLSKPRYGQTNALIVRLLREYLNKGVTPDATQ